MTETWFVLICRECGHGDLPMPFTSAAERGEWAAAHTRATGHDTWRVIDHEYAPQEMSPLTYASMPAWKRRLRLLLGVDRRA